MVKCPNPDCGYENVDGTQFCEGCGEELPQAGAASHAAPAATPGVLIKCPACENLNPADNVVCEVCGTELHPAAAAHPAATPAGEATPAVAPAVAPTAVFTLDDSGVSSPAAAPAVPHHETASIPPAGGEPALTTQPDADVPVFSIPGLDDSSLAATSAPVVAAGPVSSGVTTPDTLAAQLADADVAASGTGALEPGGVKLVVEQGMTVGKQFVLGDSEVLVGREDDDEQIYPDIDLSDQDEGYVHRRHAQLKFANGSLTVEHLGGANKTRVNNRPLPDNEPTPVKIGDKIAFGKVVMRLQAV